MAMAALRITIFVLATVCGMVMLNALGIMEPHKTPEISSINVSQADSITKISSNTSTDDVANDLLFGATSVLSYFAIVKDVAYMALLPGPYLIANGANIYVAGLVQALDSLAVVLMLLQIFIKFGFGDSNV